MGKKIGTRKQPFVRPRAKKEDQVIGKANPHSMIETLRSIRKHWAFTSDHKNKERSVSEFSSLIKTIYISLYQKYCTLNSRGNPREPGNIKDSKIEKFEPNTDHLMYIDLRAYADFIRFQTGGLLIFTHIIGLISRTQFSKQHIVSFLDHLLHSLSTLRNHIAECQTDEHVHNAYLEQITKTDGRITSYFVKAEPLQNLQTAFISQMPNEDDERYAQFMEVMSDSKP